MVLHHIAQRAGFFVVTAALAHAEFSLTMTWTWSMESRAPEPLENRVEKRNIKCSDRFLAECNGRCGNLLFVGVSGQLGVQAVGDSKSDRRAFPPRSVASPTRRSCATTRAV